MEIFFSKNSKDQPKFLFDVATPKNIIDVINQIISENTIYFNSFEFEKTVQTKIEKLLNKKLGILNTVEIANFNLSHNVLQINISNYDDNKNIGDRNRNSITFNMKLNFHSAPHDSEFKDKLKLLPFTFDKDLNINMFEDKTLKENSDYRVQTKLTDLQVQILIKQILFAEEWIYEDIELNDEITFSDMGMDSLDTLAMYMLIEQWFGVLLNNDIEMNFLEADQFVEIKEVLQKIPDYI